MQNPLTESGLLAGAHLSGAPGLAESLANGTFATLDDANGTKAIDYVRRFGGYILHNPRC